MKVKTFISWGRNLEKFDEMISKFISDKQNIDIKITFGNVDGGLIVYVVTYDEC